MDDELRGRLRDAAASHRPDRARMLARIEQGTARDARPGAQRAPRDAWPWLRVVGATAAVCGVLAMGAFAVTTAGHGERGRSNGARPAGPAAPSAPVSSVPASPAPASPAPASPAPAPAPGPRGGALPAEDGPLWTGGSVDEHSNRYWAQSNVTLRAGQPLSALTVELRIALTGGVVTTGSWRSPPEEDFVTSAREEDGFLVYRWTLKPGRTVPVGTFTFAGQYNHAEGDRDAGRDDYTVRGLTPGRQVAAGGDFSVPP